MSFADELAGLKQRLVTDPDRRATVERRIREVQDAIGALPPVIETAAADHAEVESAVVKKAAPKKAKHGDLADD